MFEGDKSGGAPLVGGTLGTNVGAGRGAEAFEGGMWQVSRLTGVALAPSIAKKRWLKIKFNQRTEGGGCSKEGFEEKGEIFSPAYMLSDFYGCESKGKGL